MYKCQNCQKTIPAGIKAYRIPVKFRYRRYPSRERANYITNEHRSYYRDDPGGEGREIAQEITVCPDCACQLTQP